MFFCLCFLGKFSANTFALSDEEDNTSGPLNRRGIADLLLLRTLLAICQNSRNQNFWEVMDSFVLLAYASFTAWRTLKQWLIACLNFRIRRFILLVQAEKMISLNYGSSTRSWKAWRWVRLDMIFSMRDIYINSNLNPLKNFPSSRKAPNTLF